MNCEGARDSILLAAYGELPDEQAVGLEQHLLSCELCLSELEAMRELNEKLALHPVQDVDPNFVAQSRMRLDEALDAIPQHGFLTRLQADTLAWLGHLKSAPALATLLVGVGFLSGNFVHRWQDSVAPKAPGVVVLSKAGGGVSTISGISQLPNDMVRVSYNRVVQEEAQGSLDDPQIRRLLMLGTKAADSNAVRADSIALITDACKLGRECRSEAEGTDERAALIATLRKDRSPGVRLKVLDGLQPYVTEDEQVRDAVSQALLSDPNSQVRTRAFAVLQPVLSDTSVRQALQTASTTDENPYIRTVSTEALRNSSSLQ
jgi:hypothetical protein